MVVVENSILAQVDMILSSGSFGDDKSLVSNIRTLYTGIQRIVDKTLDTNFNLKIFSYLPVAQVLTRATLDEVFVLLKNGNFEEARQKVDALEECFNLLANNQSEGSIVFPLQKLHPLNNLGCNKFLVEILDRVRGIFAREGLPNEFEFIEPTKSHYKSIEDGQSLLSQLVPYTASSTLSLVRCLLLVDGAIESAYFNETPFMYIVGQSRLNDSLQTADTLLHEALHQKMTDIRLTRQILCEEYDNLESKLSEDILVPWGSLKPRAFSIDRGLAAYHFYVHSVLVHASALDSLSSSSLMQSIGGKEITSRLLLSFNRADFFENKLNSNSVQSKMGIDGISFLTWMKSAMTQLREIRLLDKTKLGEHRLT